MPCDFVCCQCMENNPYLLFYSHLLLDDQPKSSSEIPQVNGDEEDSNVDITPILECKWKSVPSKTKYSHTFFFEPGWKGEICKCEDCLERYRKNHVEFLLEETELVEENEEEEVNKEPVSVFDTMQNAFLKSNIPHTSKIDIISGFNKFSSNLKTYLNDFAKSGKEVTKEDIDRFVDDMNRKRRRLG